ncbi:EF-hand calcium-binding domain-containing protein 6 [Protopterus annectens]|uniref:EF-hand calcium-binding domain-containing protein 6 n=1 Tax=Protopterus annectens TaxID=7888 RepID=UPI001CFC0FB7|nr:EF-hand calcium-binding domain-containing protein 6 [Protopterus annectens]
MSVRVINSPSEFAGLRPESHKITFCARPHSGQSRPLSRQSSQTSSVTPSSISVGSSPNPEFSAVDVDQILIQKITEKQEDVKRAFQICDTDHSLGVTKGEFRRVIENFILPLTQVQFDTLLIKIPFRSNGTIPYMEFLEQYSRVNKINDSSRCCPSQGNQTMTLAQLELLLKQKISKNLKNVIRGFRLFDYNHNGHIQYHELRKVLEKYCFRMKDAEYDRLWHHYDTGYTGALRYGEFLEKLGLNVDSYNKPIPESTRLVLNWEAVEKERQKHSVVKSFLPSDTPVEDLTLDELEMAFRRKMEQNTENIWKAFQAFDIENTGFISLQDLQAIINNFIFPMNDSIFQGLMTRFGFKATGKIAWEQFLFKFSNPVADGNGQTLPIKSNHRVNPVRGVDEDFSTQEILEKLHRHVQAAYPSLKKAFLVFDDNHDGKITRKELRRIVESLTFKMSDEQFKELCILLDPQHSGFISYHSFLEVFEEKESLGGHKWLHSTRPIKEATTVTMAWDTVEKILCEKITECWKEIRKALQYSDATRSGSISPDNLRNILHTFCLHLSDEHFEKLCQYCHDERTGRIFYGIFLDNLGVVIQEGDFFGISTQIHKNSVQNEEKRHADLSARLTQIENEAIKLTKNMKVEDVIARLKDRMAQREINMRGSFFSHQNQPDQKISKNQFRKVLESWGMSMIDSQFDILTEMLGFKEGMLSYIDFLTAFEDNRVDSILATLHTNPNKKTKCEHVLYLTAEQCLTQIMDKLQGFGNLYTVFSKMDTNHDGIINMHDFRDLFNVFTLFITEKEFCRLLQLLGLSYNSTLNYKEFLYLFQVQETVEAHPWLQPAYRPNQTLGGADLACEQVHRYLVTKAESRWDDLSKAFSEYNSNGKGVIQKKDLRAVLYRFSLPITSKEFEKLWSRYDVDGKGYLTQEEFLQQLGIELAPADHGISKSIIDQNMKSLIQQQEKQQQKQQKLKEQQKLQTQALPSRHLEQQLKDILRDYYHDLRLAFEKLDLNQDGYVTLQDLQRLLHDYHYYPDEEQFRQLLKRLGISVHECKLPYLDFLRAVDDGRASKYGQKTDVDQHLKNGDTLSPERALTKIRETAAASRETLCKAFCIFDKMKNGAVTIPQFRQVLDNFCFKLTDKQYKYILSKIKPNEDRLIDWISFLKTSSNSASTDEWFQNVEKVMKQKATQELSMSDILTRIQEVVSARFYTIAKAFADVDFGNIDVVSKEAFKEIFYRHFMHLTDEQFANLWNIMPVNDFQNLKYCDFLKMYSGKSLESSCSAAENVSPTRGKSSSATAFLSQSTSLARRPKTAPSVLRRTKCESPQRPTSALARSPVLVNCEQTEQKLKKKIYQNWKKILRECKEKDLERTGQITASDFLAVIENLDMKMTQEELEQLIVKYDTKNKGKFSYPEFIHHFVLVLKPQEGNLLKRMKVPKSRIPLKPGIESIQFTEVMLTLQAQILQCWRPMRRTFRELDETGSGCVTLNNFRQVLRQYSINLSEEEFFHLTGFYDKDLTSMISYNDFLRAFLR